MARRSAPSLRRRAARFDARLQLHVFCEGKNTEPEYLRAFSFHWGNKQIRLEVIPGVGVAMTVAREAVIRRGKLLQEAKRRRADSFASRFEVWAVFDRDNHPDINNAVTHATANGVKVGLSNPCFELWALLHFQDQDGEITGHHAQRELQRHMPRYDRYGSKILDYEAMRDQYEIAKTRAMRICERRIQEGIPRGNPSTDVHILLNVVISEGSNWRRNR